MSNFVPGNYDLRTALIFCYHLKKTAVESHRNLSKLTVSMLLVNHNALSGLKNSKVAILTWETKNVENHRKSLKTANCKHCWMRMTLKLNNNSRINWMWHEKPSPSVWNGKDPEDGKMGPTWTEWKTAGKPKNHLRNAARQVQKKVISPSNCDWRWKVDIFWES